MIAERELSTSEATLRLKKLCQRLSLNPKISYQGNHKLVATCSLQSRSGENASSGAGKGQHSGLGAIAESLEHYFLDHGAADQTHITSGECVHACAQGHDDWILNSVPTSIRLSSFRMEALESNSSIYVPSILLNPTLQYIKELQGTEGEFLTKYSSNSGMALGCTENEALLHAINECIERHALSIYYLSICKLIPAPKLMKPSHALLKETFSDNDVLFSYSQDLSIYMLTDFYGLFFCVAIGAPEQDISLAVIGSGCSASPNVALYRAVTEQVQCARLRGDREKDEDHETARMLSTSTRLSSLLYPITKGEAGQVNPLPFGGNLREQIQQTTAHLKAHGRSIFYRTLFNEPGLACVVQAYIPGLERFHLIRSGFPVVPQSVLSQGSRNPHVYL
ncbi:ribosomal protein S12 methylthiotransferase accessory factor [Pseudomonas hunanensis]|uniref:Ribosomal protein S12 methylthiotransferase accessory factor n=1 Tax=Pseudomonas hunanensis TaxID=1247546 RepID=A0ACC6K0V8_9PSED|nr:YcaO-like family protein [Pseudomonas hunanensis]MDR6712068.1 ribosomal protein S12 methylthiotransferase accessory factor [Pseudomonas hunanensis]